MGVQFAPNIFSVLPTSNQHGATSIPENWVTSGKVVREETGFDLGPFEQSMGRQLEDCSREVIKNTMLMHEKIFKEQVSELHRLYHVQKMLMNELNMQLRPQPMTATTSRDLSDTKSSFLSSQSPPFRDKHSSITRTNPDDLFRQSNSAKAEGSSQGQTICPEEAFRQQRGFNIELVDEQSQMRAFMTLQDNPKRIENRNVGTETLHRSEDEDSDLELTLSIGSFSSRKQSKQRQCSNPELDLIKSNSVQSRQLSDHSEIREEENGRTDATLSSDGAHRSTWNFQSLRLNK